MTAGDREGSGGWWRIVGDSGGGLEIARMIYYDSIVIRSKVYDFDLG